MYVSIIVVRELVVVAMHCGRFIVADKLWRKRGIGISNLTLNVYPDLSLSTPDKPSKYDVHHSIRLSHVGAGC